MTRHIPARLRRLVFQRAGDRCEYCGLGQAGQAATFHIDQIVPLVAGGETTAQNLALACVSCSLHKSARQKVLDPETATEVAIFHPRRHRWTDHFRREGAQIVGVTAIGRATAAALEMNRPTMRAIRAAEDGLRFHQLE